MPSQLEPTILTSLSQPRATTTGTRSITIIKSVSKLAITSKLRASYWRSRRSNSYRKQLQLIAAPMAPKSRRGQLAVELQATAAKPTPT